MHRRNLSITVQIFVALKDDLGCDRSELHAHLIGGTERSCRGASLVLPERPIAELAVLGVALTLLGLGLWLIPTRVPLFCITGELSRILAAAVLRLRQMENGGSG